MDKEIMTKLARLENEIRQLRDEQVKQRRLNEDMMFNLDDDNFSSSYKVEQGNKFAQFKMTADEISAKVGKLSGGVSSLSIEADNISSTVTKIYGEARHSDSMPDSSFDTDVMYEYNGTYYYYNDVTSRWTPVSENSVVSKIIQTKSGFKLSGDVAIDGNVITNGVFETKAKNGMSVRLEEDTIAISGYYTKVKDENGNDIIVNEDYFSIGRTDLADLSMHLHDAATMHIGGGGTYDFRYANINGLYAVFA